MTATVSNRTTATYAPNQKLTAAEAEQARLFLDQAQNAVVGATKGLSDAQWNFKPAPDRWSIAENLAHMVIVQERVLGPMMQQLPAAPAPPADLPYQVIDALVINQFPNRLTKYSAPETVQPVPPIGPKELLIQLSANQARLATCLNHPELRQHAIPSAPMKGVSKGAFELMDGYQWILAAAAHTERHAKQMLEVKADPGFPA